MRHAMSAGTVLALSLAVSPAAAAVITGTGGDDRLTGTSGADVIRALGGDDVVDGRAGSDRLYGGVGADMLFGGGARDLAGTGNDRVKTIDDGLRDLIDCGGGADRVTYYAVDGVGGLDPLDVLVGCERVTVAR